MGNPAVIVEMVPKTSNSDGKPRRFLISDTEIVPVKRD